MADAMESLEKQRRSLTARIKAARKANTEAELRRVESTNRDFGKWLLMHLFGDVDDMQLDARVEAARSALAQPGVADHLRQLVQRSATEHFAAGS